MMYLNVLGLWEREGRVDWGLGINAEVEGGRMGVGGGVFFLQCLMDGEVYVGGQDGSSIGDCKFGGYIV